MDDAMGDTTIDNRAPSDHQAVERATERATERAIERPPARGAVVAARGGLLLVCSTPALMSDRAPSVGFSFSLLCDSSHTVRRSMANEP